VEGLRADGILDERDSEDEQRAHSQVRELVRLLQQGLARVLHDTGERADRLRRIDALAHEQRGDDVPRIETRLGDQVAQRLRRPEPTGPDNGEHASGTRCGGAHEWSS
jgi:hypothetical protein